MMRTHGIITAATPRGRRAGFTMIEAVMSLLLVSVLLVAAMRATAGSGVVQFKTAERTSGRLLADALMTDIITLSYEDPDASTPVFGIDSGESSGSKVAWDDVDDFNGWSESPPQNKDGVPITLLSDWRRDVRVEWVSASAPTTVSATESGAKRITVTVTRNGRIVATRVAIRTKAPE